MRKVDCIAGREQRTVGQKDGRGGPAGKQEAECSQKCATGNVQLAILETVSGNAEDAVES